MTGTALSELPHRQPVDYPLPRVPVYFPVDPALLRRVRDGLAGLDAVPAPAAGQSGGAAGRVACAVGADDEAGGAGWAIVVPVEGAADGKGMFLASFSTIEEALEHVNEFGIDVYTLVPWSPPAGRCPWGYR